MFAEAGLFPFPSPTLRVSHASVHLCRWVGNLEEEFFRQGDQEKLLGLPVSPLFDRDKLGVTKSQVGGWN